MPKVLVVRTTDGINEAFTRAMELAGLGGIVPRGSTVLFKPNQHGGPGYTSPEVIRAAVLWARSQGAAEVWVGDGPYWALADATPYFRETGLERVCRETGARMLAFHDGPFTTLHPDSPDLPPVIGITEYLYQADVVINLPVMKTHFNTLVTLGIKNLKGCLRPVDKKTLHEMELNAAVAEVARLLRPHISATVLDATTAFEGMGPSAATPVDMHLLLASSDMVALDAVACDLMSIQPSRCRLIRCCAERGVGTMDLQSIEVLGEDLSHHRRRFELPYEALARQFPGLKLHTEHACSGCTMNLFCAMEIAKKGEREILWETITVGPAPPDGARNLLVGKCAIADRDGPRCIPGCPPRVDEIRLALTGEQT